MYDKFNLLQRIEAYFRKYIHFFNLIIPAKSNSIGTIKGSFFYICNTNKPYKDKIDMNTLRFRRIIIVIFTFMMFPGVTFTQINNIDFLRAGADDGVKLIEAYMSPMANAFGAALNGSWYNSAKPHKLGGFDLTISFNTALIPESASTFNVEDLELTTLSGSGPSPTISGPETPGPTMTKTENGVVLSTFALPPGTNWKQAYVPTANIGVGLPFGTELKVRYIPLISINKGNLSLWGVGVMHNITQYFSRLKLLPFDISVFGGYTKLQGNIPVSLQVPNPLPTGTVKNYTTPSFTDGTGFADQNIASAVQAWNVSVIGSVNLSVVSFYGGLGYSKTQTEMILKGNYPTPLLVTTPTPHPEYNDEGVLSGSEIPAIDITNLSGVRANIGMRLKFSIMTIHFDYTRSQYNVISGGLGISFR
jgi:hypothetical protein